MSSLAYIAPSAKHIPNSPAHWLQPTAHRIKTITNAEI